MICILLKRYINAGREWVMKKLYSSELYHHGVKGQKWGVRNGPPYPLEKSQKSGIIERAMKQKLEHIYIRHYHRRVVNND